MQKTILLIAIVACCSSLCHAQYPRDDEWNVDETPTFEVYALASGMRTIDATGTVIIRNPEPNQSLGFTPAGLASGARVGFAWRYENVALFAESGFHRYSDHMGSTSMAPFMAGIRGYSREQSRTSFFGEVMAGGYRWTVNSGSVNFVTVKGIVLAGGGMDVRLTHRLVWRIFEFQLGIAGARNGPLLTGGPSTGIAYRFGER